MALAKVYNFFFALWQLALLRRCWEGIVDWAGTAWVLLLLSLAPVWLAWDFWLGARAVV